MLRRVASACFVLLLVLIHSLSTAQTITGITPPSGVAGTQITISGQGLKPTQSGLTCIVFLGNRGVTPSTWTDSTIILTVPSNLPGNTTTVPVLLDCFDRWDDYPSNTVNWTILQPIITMVNPNTALPNTDVTITGSGFGAVQVAA